MSVRTIRSLALAAWLFCAGCALHQAVYAPVGWPKNDDGSYSIQRDGWTLTMPPLVIDRSDKTLYPALWMKPGTHQIHVANAEWRVSGRRFPAIDTGYRSDVVSTTYPLDLRWEFRRENVSLIDGLSVPSTIHLQLNVDGKEQIVDIPVQRIDRY
jgi:hypothetical protein